jgi:electron-transferring-flavoprotein dehydrogenase
MGHPEGRESKQSSTHANQDKVAKFDEARRIHLSVQTSQIEEIRMSTEPTTAETLELDRPSMEVDIACAGFGPATGGFLTTLTQEWNKNPADPAFESRVAPGMPLQVVCYERADDIGAGVSGVVTRAQGIRLSFPDLNPAEIPMAAEVKQERVLYLLDPIGASRRSFTLRAADAALRGAGRLLGIRDHAFELPWTPGFLNKHGGLVMSIGQFNQWVGAQLMTAGLVQIWPGTPASEPLFSGSAVTGLRLADQGVERSGAPGDGFMAGMDVRALLTVVGDGPVGAIGQAIDERVGLPEGHAHREWALGMKFVIELPADADNLLEPGTVWHTFGYPEPEIFGFLYVHPERLVSVGIFVPSWMSDPSRTAYRYLQHYIQHPALWGYLKDGTLRSWGAKSLEESGKRGEPFLTGDGYARIGEGSGSTNMLTGSGVDEAWTTGVQLAEAVLELLRAGKPFTHENLAATYETRRQASWVERGAREAENARNGFHGGLVRGLIGMALAGLSGGRLGVVAHIRPAHKQIRKMSSRSPERLKLKNGAVLAIENGRPLHDALLTARGWPEIAFDGRLLVTHQDALLMGGKVQAMPGFADHVAFRDSRLCITCVEKTCIAMCSGQALTEGADGVPAFEREKCVHCGACLWNCANSPGGEGANVEFRAGAGGLHSVEN